MELEIYGDEIYTRTIVDAEGKVFVLLTPTLIKKIDLLNSQNKHLTDLFVMAKDEMKRMTDQMKIDMKENE